MRITILQQKKRGAQPVALILIHKAFCDNLASLCIPGTKNTTTSPLKEAWWTALTFVRQSLNWKVLPDTLWEKIARDQTGNGLNWTWLYRTVAMGLEQSNYIIKQLWKQSNSKATSLCVKKVWELQLRCQPQEGWFESLDRPDFCFTLSVGFHQRSLTEIRCLVGRTFSCNPTKLCS